MTRRDEQPRECPFCGSKDVQVAIRPELKTSTVDRPRAFAYVCGDCLSHSGWYPTGIIARDKWDTREGERTVKKQIAKKLAEEILVFTGKHDDIIDDTADFVGHHDELIDHLNKFYDWLEGESNADNN